MPVVGLIGGMMLLAIAIGVGGMLLVFVVLPAAGIGLIIWLGVYLYQQSQAEDARRKEEREKQEEEERVAARERQAIAQKEELKRIEQARIEDDDRLSLEYGTKAARIYQNLLPTGPGQFMVPLCDLPLTNTIVSNICDVFWAKELTDRNLCADIRDHQRYGSESVGSKERPVWPKDYNGPNAHKIYLPQGLWYIFDVLVPFSFPDTLRFTHHWCLGDNGTGKTTYLRHLIKHDLERAQEGECSLVVIDSKKLIREMRTLKQFATLEPLIIDSDQLFPLNPFKLPRPQASDVLLYMLANLTEASELQTGALSYYVDAACQTPDATLRTILKYARLDSRKGELPDAIDDFDPDTQDWFRHTRKTLHPSTGAGIEQRLANFLKRYPRLDKMFSADSFGLDFSELNKGGKVVLVDTDRAENGKEGANILGRLIIALIDQLSSKRTKLPESTLKPVWVYIDEAHDYIAQDHIFADILEKARAQRIGITVAHHHTGQVDPRIEQSLQNAGIKSRCRDIGSVQVQTRRENLTLPVERLDFDHEPQMKREEYAALRARLKGKYPYMISRTEALVAPQPSRLDPDADAV